MCVLVKTVIVAAVAAVLALLSAQGEAQSISKDEYRERVLVLFGEFLQMKEDGVFLDQATIKALGPTYEFSDTIRGSNPPGGFFARPPGSDWLRRVDGLRDTGHKFVCFDIPAMPSGTGICGFDLISLHAGIMSPDDISFLDSVAARFWLATICHRNPEVCEPHVRD